MYLVDKDGRTVFAEFVPDPPNGRGADSWNLSISVSDLNDHNLFLHGLGVPDKYRKYMRPEDRAEVERLTKGCPCPSHHPDCDCEGMGGDR